MHSDPAAGAERTVLFVHGMYMTPLCWERWDERFRAAGYKTLAPAWPGHDAPIDEQRRRHPDPKLGALTLEAVLARYREVLRGLAAPPLLIGHSMGGLIVQLLLQEGLARAAIALDSAPPYGVLTPKWSFYKSNWPAISPFVPSDEPVALTYEQFCYSFVNGLPEAEQRRAYERYVVPESRQIGRAPTTAVARIDWKKAHPPLLLIAGAADHIIPASLNESNYRRYQPSAGRTDFKVFPGRTHYLLAQEGWEEIAQYALDWDAALAA